MKSDEAICCDYGLVQCHLLVLLLSLPQSVDPESILSKPPACKPPSQSQLLRERDLGNLLHKAFPHSFLVNLGFPFFEIL